MIGAALVTSTVLSSPAVVLAAPAAGPVHIDGVLNVRDIGGHRGAAGRSVASGRVYRSATLSTATDAGVADLTALGLYTDIDLRSTYSRQINGADRLPAGVAQILAPVGDGDESTDGAAGSRLLRTARLPGVLRSAVPVEPSTDTLDEFRSYITSASNRVAASTVLRTLVTPGSTPLLYHCNSGTFVTGWMTTVILSLVGVDRAEIDAEFLLSNDSYGSTVAFTEYLDAAFDQISTTFGGWSRYVERGLGIGTDEITALRSALLV